MLCYTDLGTSNSVSSLPSLMFVFTVAHILLQSLVKTYLDNFHPGMPRVLFWILVVEYLEMCELFKDLGSHPFCESKSPKKGMLVHLKRHLSLLSFMFACLHTQSTLSNVSSWYLTSSLKPAIKMSSVILNTFGIPLNI